MINFSWAAFERKHKTTWGKRTTCDKESIGGTKGEKNNGRGLGEKKLCNFLKYKL